MESHCDDMIISCSDFMHRLWPCDKDLYEVLGHGDDGTVEGILDNHGAGHRDTVSEAWFLHQNNHIHLI